jgi:hypothetical protein
MGSNVLMATFDAKQYLGDPQCQKLMLDLSRTWKGIDPASSALIASIQ